MRREHASHRRLSNRIIWTVLGVILVLIIATVWGVHHATAPVNQAKTQSISIAKKYAGLKTSNGFYWTNLNATYYTVAGTNQQNKAVYIIVPQKGGHVRVLNQSSGMTRNQALSQVWTKHKPQKVLSAALSVFNNRPAWIISYMNQKGQLCYETLSFKSGKVLQSIENI
ncbi:DUF5590 domain-containing protein [Secundilactobacillus folii]|uniref:Cell wall elongation regulator TseB-like domain-containing protein n=1 Tax=Secundilactobacillus folii TaxID=2678357 RepID=A0A7X3C260_9LACO|nr:DUF5590 domain-containing protein [Secundilactobacillus folii]MTV81137.1 hypothetical protein [Secundilactobacillus folii]